MFFRRAWYRALRKEFIQHLEHHFFWWGFGPPPWGPQLSTARQICLVKASWSILRRDPGGQHPPGESHEHGCFTHSWGGFWPGCKTAAVYRESPGRDKHTSARKVRFCTAQPGQGRVQLLQALLTRLLTAASSLLLLEDARVGVIIRDLGTDGVQELIPGTTRSSYQYTKNHLVMFPRLQPYHVYAKHREAINSNIVQDLKNIGWL